MNGDPNTLEEFEDLVNDQVNGEDSDGEDSDGEDSDDNEGDEE